MDKRYIPLTPEQAEALRARAVSDVVANPQWPLPETVRHLKKTMRLTTAELANMAGVGYRSLQDILHERGEGRLETMRLVLAAVGLKLVVQRLDNGPANRPG